MSGSIKWFSYKSDSGTDYAVKLDESNATALGFAAPTAGLLPLPKGWKMRQVNCVLTGSGEGAGFYRRSFPVGSLTAGAWTAETALTLSGGSWQPVSRTGEKTLKAFVPDTGLTDGSP
jgi:hypothetical protein